MNLRLILLGLLILVACMPEPFNPPQPAVLSEGQGYFESGGARLFYQRWLPTGSPKAVVLLLHGLGDHVGAPPYAFVRPYLLGQGFGVYMYDARGHGYSPGARGYVGRWSEFRQDLAAFVRLVHQHQPGIPVFLLGLSMGALTALDYALDSPDGLAGVIAVAAPLGTLAPAGLLGLVRLFSVVWPGLVLPPPGEDRSVLSRDAKALEAYGQDGLVHYQLTARYSAEFVATADRVNARAAEFKPPLLMLHGSDDRVAVPDERFFAAVPLPDKTRKVYAGGRHVLFLETNREEVFADMAAWMESRF